MCERRRKSFIKGTGLVIFSRICAFGTAIVVGILTARYLGPEGKGQVVLALAAGGILGNLLCLGFDKAAPYFLASNKLTDNKVFGSWILSVVIGTAIAYGLVYPLFVAYLMNNVFEGVSKSLLLIGGLGCPLYFLQLLVNSTLQGHEDFFKRTCHDILIYLASIAAAVISLVVLNLGSLGYVQIRVGFGFCTVIFGFALLGRVIRLSPEFGFSAWLKMCRYGIKGAITQALNLIDLRLDIFIINYFIDNASVGIYTVAGGLATMFWILPHSISVVLLPRNASSSRQEADIRTAVLCRNVLWLTVISGLLFLAISKRLIIFVYTKSFADAALAFAFLMPGVVGFAVSRICYTDCSARGYPEKATYSTAVTAILTIFFDIYLIPKYGICGAAVASSIAYCTGGVLSLYWHMKLSGNSIGSLVVPRVSDLRYYRNVFVKIKAKLIR